MFARLIHYYFIVIVILFSLIFAADFIFQSMQVKDKSQQKFNTFPTLIAFVQHYCEEKKCNENTFLPIDSLRLINMNALAIPTLQRHNLNHGESISVRDENQLFLYQKIADDLILEVGPLDQDKHTPSYWYSITFYILLGCTFLFILWPLYRDIWSIKHATEKFACTKDLGSLHMPNSRFFKPVTDTINWMLHKIARLLALQNELSGTLSHELRTNLSRLKFTLTSITQNNLEESKQLLKQDVNEIQTLVEQYLNFAKNEHEEPDLTLSKVTINETVNKYLAQLGTYSNKSLTFEVHESPPVIVDLPLLSRAIKNLIDNAFKYGEQQVKVSLYKQNQQLILMVEDDGKSLDSSKVEELFLPYTRNNQHVVGYGLGLAITKKIVTWHNGDIAVSHSNTLGGACFKLILPIAGATTST